MDALGKTGGRILADEAVGPGSRRQRFEHERQLHSVARAEVTVAGWGMPVEFIEMGPTVGPLGIAPRGPAKDEVGQRFGEHKPGLAAFLAPAVSLKHLARLRM